MKTKKTINKVKFSIGFILVALFAIEGATNVAFAQKKIIWHTMQKAQQLAKKNNKKVIVFAGASWCVYCQKMDREVLPQESVIDSLNAYFYGVRVDVDSNAPMIFNGKQIAQNRFARMQNVRATPTFIFLDSTGNILGTQPGFIPTDTFSRLLGYIGSNAFKHMEFGTYLANRTSK